MTNDSLPWDHPDPFADARDRALALAETHSDPLQVPGYSMARELGVLLAAFRASYVCLSSSGVGYGALHASSHFRNTGRADVVEPDPAIAEFTGSLARQHALSEIVRVHLGAPSAVVPSLNGPYDAMVVDDLGPRHGEMADDIVRLTRTGGVILAQVRQPISGESAPGHRSLAEAFLSDGRLLCHIPTGPGLAVIVRRR
jgi:predicted O-methyltransferase YrrM